MSSRAHWERVWSARSPGEFSWHQRHPALSLELIRATGAGPQTRILDVGGGASTLVDYLLAGGFVQLSVLDISLTALDLARQRLGERASRVRWLEGDVRCFVPPHPFDIWHDRAVFHFLTEKEDRAAYRAALECSLVTGGEAIIATFGPEGPTRCSGLDVVRYGPEGIASELGSAFLLVESREERHRTPAGVEQQFVYGRFRRIEGGVPSDEAQTGR
jgi:SAM-dependent methyltransferase